MTYYIEKENLVRLVDDNKEVIQNNFILQPQYADCEIKVVPEGHVAIAGQKLLTTEEYEALKAQEEAERIAHLNLTGADVERGLYQALKLDFDDVIAKVEAVQPAGLDIKALKIELKANNFYRGNPYIDAVGQLLGLTTEQLDKFFETNDYKELIPVTEETDDNTKVTEETDDNTKSEE